MSTSTSIALNTLVQMAGKVINTLSSLLITFLLGRFLGETFYGDFTKVFATSTFLFMVLDFGLNATVVKRLSRFPHRQTLEFRHLFGLRLFIAVMLYFLLIIFLVFLPTPSGQGYTSLVKVSIAIFALQYLSQATFLSCNAIFQKHLAYLRSVISASLGSLVQLGLVTFLLLTHASLVTISLAHLAGSLAMSLSSLILVRPFTHKLFPTFNFVYIRTLFKHTAPIGFALVFNLFATHSDTILLTLMRPTEEVGFYGLARRIFDVTLVLPTFFMNAAYPVLLQKSHSAPYRLKPIFIKSLIFLLTTAFIGLIGLFLTAPLITLIRTQFSPSIFALRILSLSLPVFFATNLLLWTSIAVGKQASLVTIYALALLVNLSLNLILIPRFGYLASAITTGVTEAVILILLIRPVAQSLKFYDAKT